MRDGDRQTRTRLVELFAQRGLYPRHDLGQNFLVDLNLHEMIVRQARLNESDVVLEVGAGTGGLTQHLAQAAGRVVSVECDPHVFEHAESLLAGHANTRLIFGDALAGKHEFSGAVISAIDAALARVKEAHGLQPVGFASDVDDDNPWVLRDREPSLKLIANLPYQVATPVMSNLIASPWPWTRMVVTIQWELAERMTARPGTSDYSALTVWMQSQAKLKIIRKLPPSVFWPPPKVDSAVLVVDRDLESQATIADRAFFHEFIREVFTQRRKQIAKLLAGMCAGSKRPRDGNPGASQAILPRTREELDALFVELKIPANARAEQLPVEQLVALANQLCATTADVPSPGREPEVLLD